MDSNIDKNGGADDEHIDGMAPFEYDPDDLWEAITHCVSPTAPVTFSMEPGLVAKAEVQTPEDRSADPEQQSARNPPVSHVCTTRHHKCDELKPETPVPIYVEFDDDGSIPKKYKITVEKDSEGNDIIMYTDPSQTSTISNTEEPQYPEADMRTGAPRFQLGRKYKLVLNEKGDLIVRAAEAHFDKYMYAEHCMLGNDLHLKWDKGTAYRAEDKKITLQNGLQLTYGQINGLGGDFFGTYKPICMGKDLDEQHELFIAAYNCLAKNPRTLSELPLILETREAELKAIDFARRNNHPTSEAYAKLADGVGFFQSEEVSLQKITNGRDFFGEFAAPGVIRLAQLNLDHFGSDAHTAYNAGHHCAMSAAVAGDLDTAYGMNAFADHYLGDCFAAGHIRTPRRYLHAGDLGGLSAKVPLNAVMFAKDMCSKYMHDEDNALGLTVRNRKGETWKAYGDKKMFEPINDDNRERLARCLQASADEVFACFLARKMVVADAGEYAAWHHAPVLDAALDGHNHSPLFTREGDMRTEIGNPKCWKHQPLPFYKAWASVYYDLRTCETFKKY